MRFLLCLFALGATALAQVPSSNHVWVITEENHSYESVIGNSSMPYYNSLARKYGLATQYYSPMHNSLSALMWLVAGQMVTADNNTTTCWNVNNVVRQLRAQGMTWRSYQRDLPYPGFRGLFSGDYVRRHNPLIDFTDSCAAGQRLNSVPFTQLTADIEDHKTPNYAYITPNLDEDAHDGTLPEADAWLSRNLPRILKLPEFKPGGDGLLFIVWDEGDLGKDNRCSSRVKSGCGGRIATLVIGPQVKPGYRSSVLYSHANLLRTVCDAMSFASCPGAAELASPMTDFFNTVNVEAPVPNSTVTSPVQVKASNTNTNKDRVYAMQVYVDDRLAYQTAGATLNAQVRVSPGKHHLVIQSWDVAGGIHKTGLDITAQSSSVQVFTPALGSVVASPVSVRALGHAPVPVKSMHAYVDGTPIFQSGGDALNAKIPMSAGRHTLLVEARDDAGALIRNSVQLTVAKPSVAIHAPSAGSSVYSPVSVLSTTIDPNRVYAMQVYLDNQLHYEASGTGLSVPLPMPFGKHNMVVQAWDTAGEIYKKAISIDVLPIKVAVSAPTPNSTVKSPVHIHASVPANSTVFTIQVYVDNSLRFQRNSKTIDTYLSMGRGKHFIVAQAWDDGGSFWKTGVTVNVK